MTGALGTALAYIDRGWAPVPIPHKSKGPVIVRWQDLRISHETALRHFNSAAQNVGVILGPASGGLTDIDLDCPEVIGLANYFLPKTNAIFGRASKRNSHWLYVTRLAESDDKAAIRYGDPAGAGTLLEIRFGGGDKGAQTVFPGSTHEGGEEIRWECDGDPADVEAAFLKKATARTAAACLFTRYMPGSGSRHHAFCAIGGFMGRCGATGPEVKLFADAVCAAGGFDRDHIGSAVDAADAHRSGKRSYGYKTIAEIFGEKVAGKVAEWLGYKSGSDGAAYANGEAGDDHFDDLVEATKADPTAPLLPEAVERLVALEKADLAEFARVRSKLKDAGCLLAMLDKAIANAAKQVQAKKRNGAAGDGSSGFCMTPTGLFFTEDPEDPRSKTFICGPFDVLAKNRDYASESWGLLLHWKDSDDQPHTWPMPRELLAGDGQEVRRRLLAGGLNIASGLRARNKLTDYLTIVNVPAMARAVASTGWYGSAFVFPDDTIGVAGAERVILQTTNLIDHGYYVRGTLDEWKQEVARLAVGNPLLTLATSTAFAAILVGPCRYESGGIHYVGRSSRGKSSTLIAAGSVWGGDPQGNHGFVRQWRATANGLEGTAALHNNALLCLDDIKQANGREVAEVVYMLANNQGKQRASRDGSMRKVAFWQLLFLSTGEVSLADKIAEDRPNCRQSAGQQVRFIDLPCDAGAHGMFDTLHEFENARDFADHLRDAGKRQYGTACRAFIKAIAPDLDGAVSAVRESVNQFVAGNCPADSDGQVQRVATRFGLIAAAGEMAMALDILPWPADTALRAAKECFKAWVDARGGPGAAEENDGIEAVRAFLNAHRLSRFLPAWEIEAAKEAAEARAANPEYRPKYPPEQRLINLAGYRKRVGADVSDSAYDDDEDFYITDTAWKEVTAGFNRIALARALAKRAFLVVPKGGKNLSKKERIPGIAKTLRVYHVSHTIFEGQDDG